MAILIFSGKPRTGKTYKVVHDLLLPDIQGKYFIVHNIRGLKADRFINPEMVREWPELMRESGCENEEEFFSIEFQGKLSQTVQDKYRRKLLIVVDEAHQWFDKQRKALKTWLAMHGHFGQEVWLVAQRANMLHSSYLALAEYEIRAKNDHLFNNPWIFLYQKRSAGENCGMMWIRKKQSVYDAYVSFVLPGARKQKSILIPAMLVLFVVGGWWWFTSLETMAGGPKEAKEKKALAKKETPAAKVDPMQEARYRQAKREADRILENPYYSYSLAVVAGKKVVVQDAWGHLHKIDQIVPGAKLAEYDRENNRVIASAGGKLYTIERKSLTQMDAMEEAEHGGGRARTQAGAEQNRDTARRSEANKAGG